MNCKQKDIQFKIKDLHLFIPPNLQILSGKVNIEMLWKLRKTHSTFTQSILFITSSLPHEMKGRLYIGCCL